VEGVQGMQGVEDVQGVLLGNYRVMEKLGEGGMGVVYLACHEPLGHRAVVKVLRLDRSHDPDAVQRFWSEAQVATAIHHPGIVKVFDFGTTPEGRVYFVMELLEGESLAALLARERMDFVQCCRLGRQVASVLKAAHAAGITHRDLKPDNLFLVPDLEVAGGKRVKVLDFGIAKLAGELPPTVHTRTGLVMGTPSYMSPEQCRSIRAADARSDIYSLGCILFEMACGRPPFVCEGPMELIGAHVYVTPPHPQNLEPAMPPGLSALIAKMLSKHPAARPQTMAAVGQALDEVLRALGDAVPVSVPVSGPSPVIAVALPRAPSPTAVTTIVSAPGAPAAWARVLRGRLPRVLGGLAVAGALAAIGIELAAGTADDAGPRAARDEPPAARDEPPVRPPAATADAAAPTGAVPAALAARAGAGAPDASAADVEAAPSPAAEAMAAECRRHLVDQRWQDLARCAARLQPLDPEHAARLRSRAELELTSAPRIGAALEALRGQRLRQAKDELDQLSTESIGYASVRSRYDDAESQAITALARRLDRVKDADCGQYNELLATERDAQPPRVAAEAARRTTCTPRPRCNPDALTRKALAQYRTGRLAEALASYERAIGCRSTPALIQKAYVVACNLKDVTKARAYWTRLSRDLQLQAIGTCVRNGISEPMLNNP